MRTSVARQGSRRYTSSLPYLLQGISDEKNRSHYQTV